MTKRAPRVQKSKEQIAKELDVSRQKILVKEKLYPALVGATTSVDESKMLIQAITSLLMEEGMKVLREKKVSEIRASFVEKLCSEGRSDEVDALLAVLDDETLFTARVLLEGMKQVVEQMIIDEMQSRTLNSFEPNWERMLSK